MTNPKTKYSRRQVLRGLGDFTLALPFLPSLLPRSAWAQASTFQFPPFLIHLHSSLGVSKWESYFPDIADAQKRRFEQRNAVGAYQAYEADLPVVNNAISPVFGSAFAGAAVRNNLILVRGLDYDSNPGHNDALGFGNYGSGESTPEEVRSQTYDNYLGKMSGFDKRIMRISPGAFKQPRSWYRGSGLDTEKHALTAHGAANLFNVYFGATAITSGVAPASVGPQEVLIGGEYRSVVDRVIEDYRRVLPKLGREDRLVFEEHIAEINDLDRATSPNPNPGMGGPSPVVANTCGPSRQSDYVNSTDALAIVREWHDQIRVMGRAIKCGLVQLCMVNVQSGASKLESMTYSHTGGDTDFHAASHNAVYSATSGDPNNVNSETFAYRRLLGAHQWTAENVFLRLFQELDKPAANSQSFMRNGVIMWSQENCRAHATHHIPIAIATRRADMPGGRIIDYTHWDNPRKKVGGDSFGTIDGVRTRLNTGKVEVAGQSYRRLLVSLIDSLGFDGSAMPTTGANGVANPYNTKNNIRFERCNESLTDAHFKSPLTRLKV